MEVIVNDPHWDHESFLKDLQDELSQLTADIQLRDTDIGCGTSWEVVLASLGGLFLLGKPIKDNLEAWLSLGQKFVSVLKRIATKFGAYRVDEHGATLIAVTEIANTEPSLIRSLELLTAHSIRFYELVYHESAHLDHHPDTLYLQSYRVNGERIYVLGIKSNGKLEFKHAFSTSYFEF
jgi:hypothetical protein